MTPDDDLRQTYADGEKLQEEVCQVVAEQLGYTDADPLASSLAASYQVLMLKTGERKVGDNLGGALMMLALTQVSQWLTRKVMDATNNKRDTGAT